MKKLKVLNCYAGIGGNRKLWADVDVTAIEINPEIAKIYQDFFPKDNVIVTDAHQYLLNHYSEFDFIWSSPPCVTHSQLRRFDTHRGIVRYANLELYQEIILLKEFYLRGSFVVENVIPYYTPLIPAQKVDRHLFWTNFKIGNFILKNKPAILDSTIDDYQSAYNINLNKYDLPEANKRKFLANCVHPETGLYILNCARGVITKQNEKQISLFDEKAN